MGSGAVLTLWTIFKNSAVARTDEGYVILGAVIICTSLLMFGIYFPDMGGMLFKPGRTRRRWRRWPWARQRRSRVYHLSAGSVCTCAYVYCLPSNPTAHAEYLFLACSSFPWARCFCFSTCIAFAK